MASDPKRGPWLRPQLPESLIDQVVAKAQSLGEEVADQPPAVIIRTILRRYVDGAPLAPPRRSSLPPAPASEQTRTVPIPHLQETQRPGASDDPRSPFRERVFTYFATTIQGDGLTKPIGNKNLAKQVGVSANFIRTLIAELLDSGRLVEVEPSVGTRGPRYRIVADSFGG